VSEPGQASRPLLPSLLSALATVPIVGILRGCPAAHATSVASVAQAAGLRVLEVTLDSPEALEQIRSIGALDLDLVVGVGTVTTADQVTEAVAAGARFVVSPVVGPSLVTRCVEAGVPCVPGAATPTEIVRALELGATAVKVFPAASLGGPGFVAAVSGPLGHPPLVPTGGVDLENADRYLAAGAVAVGAGSAMFEADALRRGDLDLIGEEVGRWVTALAR
jgi:2-dehydro-3-deoxyphosphogluconate aldolase / (4S)-4-hydroxy-2-oxoglutarate aldolase